MAKNQYLDISDSERDESNESQTEDRLDSRSAVAKTKSRQVAGDDEHFPSKPEASKPQIKDKKSKPGVLYFSRLPPYLRPNTLRRLLSAHGSIGNIFLTPESPAAYSRRVRSHHGNKKRQYVDGWVEFKHKRHAKACRDAINGRTTAQSMGVGKSRKGAGWYRDDVWSVRYLRGFTWDDLMREGRGEEREREEKVRVGLAREKRLRSGFLDAIESAKIQETRRQKAANKQTSELPAQREEAWSFRQNAIKQSGTRDQPDDVNRVLSKIF